MCFVHSTMSYQVIARKYRPQRFADVVGQEHVTQTLANAIEQKRIAHAYLFVGPRGTGKTTIARIFAKALNCTDGPKADFSNDDPRCKEITEGRSLDVLEIDGASNRGIDEIRDLRETVKYSPASCRYKIYIIDEVHMLTKEAFNALLKTLEEPPEHVKFMFATTEPEKVLATILSRCQRFDLRRIPSPLIVQHLAEISKLEKVEVDEPALLAIARGSEGCMRDAESTLDQLISFCGTRIQESDVLSIFGLTAHSHIVGIAGTILSGDTEGALKQFNDLARNGKDLARLLSDLLGHFRNLLIYVVSKGHRTLLEISESEAASLKLQAADVTADALTRIMEVFADAEGRLRDVSSKKILIEVTLLKAIEARNALSIDALLGKLNALRGSGSRADGASPAPALPKQVTVPVAEPVAAKPARAPIQASAKTAEVDAASAVVQPIAEIRAQATPPAQVEHAPDDAASTLERLWSQVLDAVGRASPFTRTYLLEAHPVSFERNTFLIGFDPEFKDHLGLVDNPKNRALIQTKLAEFGHPNSQVKFIEAIPKQGRQRAAVPQSEAVPSAPVPARSSGSATATPRTASESKNEKIVPAVLSHEEFKNDPLIKKALEIFKGQIVEVRV
jgi:DNA polymerase-3 subunit gamma/tau